MNRPPRPAARFPRRMIFGARCTLVRFLEPGDRSRLVAFFASHTLETVRSRYGYTFNVMPPARAEALVGVDQIHNLALGVFENEGPGGQLVAVGRACALPNGKSAELAFVVHEKWRRLGIATGLFHLLVQLLRERGFGEIVAQVEPDNPGIVRIFRRAGAEIAALTGTSGLAVRLRL